MDELNIGADWEQSKRLVVHWHKMWSKEKLLKDFIVAYTNPADTSFRQMMDTFLTLSDEKKSKVIDLCKALADVSAS